MSELHPTAKVDERFSEPGAGPTPWADAEAHLESDEAWWITTVRADGRPHVTPLIALWHDGALHFCTGDGEQKYKNLQANPHCALTTGTNSWTTGFDLVVEGEAVEIGDAATLQTLADLWEEKYGHEWHFDVRDDAFWSEGGGRAPVFAVHPRKALGFAKGPHSQTSWRFD